MPSAPARLCQTPRCPGRTTNGAYCVDCKRNRDRTRRERRMNLSGAVIYASARWKRFRLSILRTNAQTREQGGNDGLCRQCNKALAIEVHHTIDVQARPDMAFCEKNVQCWCKSCHSQETARRLGWGAGGTLTR